MILLIVVLEAEDHLAETTNKLDTSVEAMTGCAQTVIRTAVDLQQVQESRTSRYIPRATSEDIREIIVGQCGEESEAEADIFVRQSAAVSESAKDVESAEDESDLAAGEVVAGVAYGSTSGWALG